MADYTPVNDFSAKDALTTGDSEKIISGADVDAETAAIQTAIATKYDSDDIASEAQAQAETSNSVLITPLRLANWADANGGMVGDLQALADPNADRILFWDDSAGAAALLTVGTGLAISTTTLALSHLGIQSLTDPGADRVFFWDDSAGAAAWLAFDTGDFTISGTNIALNSTISAQTITTLTSTTGNITTVNATTVNVGASALTRNAGGDPEWDGDCILKHNSTTYGSAEVYFSTSAASGGSAGDIWFTYIA